MDENFYDVVVLEFQKDKQSVGSIAIEKKDVDTLCKMHNQTLQGIVNDMLNTLLESIKENNK